MINKAAHIMVDLHQSSYLLTFKEPVETAVLKELVLEFKKENKEKQKERYLKNVF
ncbi:hypothetical protein [Cytobacillus oceanisediminis]|uniref:hypothetical protein n=1 Tax=Cytobacillus oceanisediminis TaxID=665099 RepID=UPI00031DF772|nr:hypothetical protein [Cytobacillus oceanisediminis]